MDEEVDGGDPCGALVIAVPEPVLLRKIEARKGEGRLLAVGAIVSDPKSVLGAVADA